ISDRDWSSDVCSSDLPQKSRYPKKIGDLYYFFQFCGRPCPESIGSSPVARKTPQVVVIVVNPQFGEERRVVQGVAYGERGAYCGGFSATARYAWSSKAEWTLICTVPLAKSSSVSS